MTATSQFLETPDRQLAPVCMLGGGRMMVRGAQRLLGVSLTIAALGLWLAPGASWESDVMLFKLILSVSAVIAGLALVSASGAPRAPEIIIDSIRREIRLVRCERGKGAVVLQSCAFSDLHHVEQDGCRLRLWEKSGDLLAEVVLTDRTALTSLVAGLRDAGKLA